METNNLKEQAIEAAYGEFWEQVKDFVTENGICMGYSKNQMPAELGILDFEQMGASVSGTYAWRPKSLAGIETNNGWISILSEADLPKERTFVWCMVKNQKEPILAFTYTGQFGDYFFHEEPNNHEWKNVTHYQPITKPKKPIF